MGSSDKERRDLLAPDHLSAQRTARCNGTRGPTVCYRSSSSSRYPAPSRSWWRHLPCRSTASPPQPGFDDLRAESRRCLPMIRPPFTPPPAKRPGEGVLIVITALQPGLISPGVRPNSPDAYHQRFIEQRPPVGALPRRQILEQAGESGVEITRHLVVVVLAVDIGRDDPRSSG